MAYQDIVYTTDPATGFVVFDADGYPVQNGPANANASTYIQLQNKIADEILGSSTAAQIQEAIADAIANFEGQQFWFTDLRYYGGSAGSASNLVTTAAKEVYSGIDLPVLANVPYIKNIQVIAFNNRYSIRRRTIEWIDDQSVSQTWQGLPTDYAVSGGNSIRLYPVPNATYTLILDCTVRLRPLANDTDYNAWTNRAEALIRQEAKRLLFLNIERNATQAAAMEREIYGAPDNPRRQGVLDRLRRENTARGGGGGGKMRASRGYL